ncbi:MAG: response regulator transcription factor [Prevotella sp.]|nr:response regulator transcription factor [Prevotella sp.]
MKILILEDEMHQYNVLRHMLEDLMPSALLIGPIPTVSEARHFFLSESEADIIIADIQLNDGLSFDALSCAPDNTPIIFTTAHEEYALKAFEYNSLSYLLKPIDAEMLRTALQKAQRLLPANTVKASRTPTRPKKEKFRERFMVKTVKGEKMIPVSGIRYFVSEQKNTYLKLLDNTSYPINIPLEKLATQLDPQRFMRVNRKFIVPLEQVTATERLSNGKEKLILKGDNPPEIIISRMRRNEVGEWIK